MKQSTNLTLIAIASFCSGWVLKPSIEQPADSSFYNPVTIDTTQSIPETATKPHEIDSITMAYEHASESEAGVETGTATTLELLLDSIEQRVAENEFSQDLERDLRTAILIFLDKDRNGGAIPELLDLANTRPRLLKRMLDHIMNIEDQDVKQPIVKQFVSGLGLNQELMLAEKYMVDKVRQGESFSKWLSWLENGHHPMRLESSSSFLENQLSFLSEPSEVAMAIYGMLTPYAFAPGWFSPEDKSRVRKLIQPYFSSPYAEIREAAVNTLIPLHRPDQSALMEQALNDEAAKVRNAAVGNLYRLPVDTVNMVLTLLKMARDERLDIGERYTISTWLLEANKLPEYGQEIFELNKDLQIILQQTREEQRQIRLQELSEAN